MRKPIIKLNGISIFVKYVSGIREAWENVYLAQLV